jgi:predicted enzyme related to lactoylglutathione lyase
MEFGSGLTEGFDYRMARTGPDTGVALTPGDHPGHPNVYIETDDLDAALSKVQELSGEAGEIREIPERLTAEIPSLALHGPVADWKDSEGNAFCLAQRNASLVSSRDNTRRRGEVDQCVDQFVVRAGYALPRDQASGRSAARGGCRRRRGVGIRGLS